VRAQAWLPYLDLLLLFIFQEASGTISKRCCLIIATLLLYPSLFFCYSVSFLANYIRIGTDISFSTFCSSSY
jgi:hypothetical protein